MIHLPGSVRVYLCLTPCDMRRSFDGLHADQGKRILVVSPFYPREGASTPHGAPLQMAAIACSPGGFTGGHRWAALCRPIFVHDGDTTGCTDGVGYRGAISQEILGGGSDKDKR